MINNPLLDEHIKNSGELVSLMQSLEFMLRAFLSNIDFKSGRPNSGFSRFTGLKAGDEVPINAFTNYDTLKDLIDKYNNNPKIMSSGLTVDESLVDIRDAIAHGRVSASTPNSNFKLIKFSKPKKNDTTVRVEYGTKMENSWFFKQVHRFGTAISTIREANKKLGYNEL
jgi:hypothetical protein